MILSHMHNFLFIKGKKVGGTSVEIALASHCGPGDVITPITPIDEFKRLGPDGSLGGGARNYTNVPKLESRYRAQVFESKGRLSEIPWWLESVQQFYNHMSYEEVLRNYGAPLTGYLVFTVERHPYDKALSLAAMRVSFESYKHGGNMDAPAEEVHIQLEKLLDSGEIRNIRNFDRYSINGKPVAQVLRQERLDEELITLASRLGISGHLSVPRAKCTNTDRSVINRDILTRRQKQVIQVLCREEFEVFGYDK